MKNASKFPSTYVTERRQISFGEISTQGIVIFGDYIWWVE